MLASWELLEKPEFAYRAGASIGTPSLEFSLSSEVLAAEERDCAKRVNANCHVPSRVPRPSLLGRALSPSSPPLPRQDRRTERTNQKPAKSHWMKHTRRRRIASLLMGRPRRGKLAQRDAGARFRDHLGQGRIAERFFHAGHRVIQPAMQRAQVLAVRLEAQGT